MSARSSASQETCVGENECCGVVVGAAGTAQSGKERPFPRHASERDCARARAQRTRVPSPRRPLHTTRSRRCCCPWRRRVGHSFWLCRPRTRAGAARHRRSPPPPPSSPGRRSPSGCRAAGATLDGARRAPSRSTRAASRGGSGCCHRLGRSGSTLMLQSAAPMIDAAGERTRATDVSAARGLASATCRWAREHRSRAEPWAETGPGANVISGS